MFYNLDEVYRYLLKCSPEPLISGEVEHRQTYNDTLNQVVIETKAVLELNGHITDKEISKLWKKHHKSKGRDCYNRRALLEQFKTKQQLSENVDLSQTFQIMCNVFDQNSVIRQIKENNV